MEEIFLTSRSTCRRLQAVVLQVGCLGWTRRSALIRLLDWPTTWCIHSRRLLCTNQDTYQVLNKTEGAYTISGCGVMRFAIGQRIGAVGCNKSKCCGTRQVADLQ